MDIEKRIASLTERLSYLRDIFAGKHFEDINLLSTRLDNIGSQDNKEEVLSTLEDLFSFIERKLESKISPMDRVRIVRNPQRICLRDILENVYDNYTEFGGKDEHNIDPSMLIARAYISRRRGKKIYNQQVMVIGQEKGHGEDIRNGGSVKPWGNAKALQYMLVAETEGIPIHTYIFTPGSYPIEDYPGAAQQIAKNLYEMAGITVPIVAVISEGGSGGAEAIGLADKRIMLSHGYYSVISPEGAAPIVAKIKSGERASNELIEHCANQLKLTAQDNLKFGYIDRIVQEPILGARPFHFEFFRNLRHEIIRATDEVILSVRGLAPLRSMSLRKVRHEDIDIEDMYVRWSLSDSDRRKLIKKRQDKFLKLSTSAYNDKRSAFKKVYSYYAERWWNISNIFFHDLYQKNKKFITNFFEELADEYNALKLRLSAPFKKLSRSLSNKENQAANKDLTSLSEWDEKESRGSNWSWISPKAKTDRAISCPNSRSHGCLDLWSPDLYGEFAGVCTWCGHHFPMEYQWFQYNCIDENSVFEFNSEIEAGNPLNFSDFDEKIAEAKKKTGNKSSCVTFEAKICGVRVVIAMLTAPFRGGSVGAAEGNKFVAAADRARRKRYPFIAYVHGTAGIRVQEGTNGVIQMPRCTIAVRKYIEEGGLYLVVYDTNSYAGPVASFLGCSPYQFAVRSSNIGFAGRGVIKETTGMEIPPDYHNCYKALAHGHIQGVWDRRDMRSNLHQALLTMGGPNLYYR